MAKGDRPVKIKRYGDIREKNIKRAGKAKRIFGFLALLLVLFAIGFLGTKAISAIIKNRGASSAVSSDTQSDIAESSSNTGEDSASQPEDSNGENVVTPTGKTRIYHYVNSQSLTSDAGIDGAITAAKNAGANCLVFDLKKQRRIPFVSVGQSVRLTACFPGYRYRCKSGSEKVLRERHNTGSTHLHI